MRRPPARSLLLSRGARAALGGLALGALLASPVLGYRQGPLGDRVGACGFGPSCWDIGCHQSYPIDLTELPWSLAQSTGPLPAGYIGGRTYELELTIDERANPFASIWGFEIAPMVGCPFPVAAGNLIALDTERTRRFEEGGLVYLSHRCTCANEDPACCGYRHQVEPSLIAWSFLWESPPAGTGDVTFAMGLNAANWDGTRDGDRVTIASLVLPEDATCPPPVVDLRVTKSACDPGVPGETRLELDWTRAGSPAHVRSATDIATAPRDRSLWGAEPSDCLALDPAPLVFYSVAEDCGSGFEGPH